MVALNILDIELMIVNSAAAIVAQKLLFPVPLHSNEPLQCIKLHACPVLIQFLPIPFSHDTITSAESQECGSEAPAMVIMEEWEGMLHFYYTLYSLLDGARSCLLYVSSLQSLLNSFSIFLEGIVIRMYCLLF